MKTSEFKRRAAFGLAALFLSGCSFGSRFASDAVDFSKTAEKVANAQVLLNVLRAKDRRPMHFAAITQFRGSQGMTSTSALGVQIPTGGDASNVFPLTPSLSLQRSTSPTFDLAALDSQEFHQGILRPLQLQLLEYYWQQRWPKEMLLYLFIHKVEEVARNGLTKVYENIPDYDSFEDFARWVKKMRKKKILIGTIDSGAALIPPIAADQLRDPQKLISIQSAGLELIPRDPPTNSTYLLCKPIRRPKVCFENCKGEKLSDACKKDAERILSAPSGQTQTPSDQALPQPGKTTATTAEGTTYHIHLRSVQGILYYLGEVMRAEQRGKEIKVRWGEKNEPKALFRLDRRDFLATDDSPLSVNYEGSIYAVQDSEAEPVSKTVMALMVQLLGLHKIGKELPTTTAVQVVGQ